MALQSCFPQGHQKFRGSVSRSVPPLDLRVGLDLLIVGATHLSKTQLDFRGFLARDRIMKRTYIGTIYIYIYALYYVNIIWDIFIYKVIRIYIYNYNYIQLQLNTRIYIYM